MSEISLAPQFIFLPEGELILSTSSQIEYPESERADPIRVVALDKLGAMPGVRTIESNTSLTAHVDINECLGNSFNNRGDQKISEFFQIVRALLPGWLEDDTDRVLGVDRLNDRDLNIVVNEHFQRWLNHQGFSEEVARDTVRSMAIPFGKENVDRIKKDFKYYATDGVGEMVKAGSFRTTVKTSEFGLIKEDSESFKQSTVMWRDTDMSTIGDCACLGADARQREGVLIQDGVKQLYEMGPHNIDFARQSLSLFLGLGTMAYHATKYNGTEDILAELTWE